MRTQQNEYGLVRGDAPADSASCMSEKATTEEKRTELLRSIVAGHKPCQCSKTQPLTASQNNGPTMLIIAIPPHLNLLFVWFSTVSNIAKLKHAGRALGRTAHFFADRFSINGTGRFW